MANMTRMWKITVAFILAFFVSAVTVVLSPLAAKAEAPEGFSISVKIDNGGSEKLIPGREAHIVYSLTNNTSWDMWWRKSSDYPDDDARSILTDYICGGSKLNFGQNPKWTEYRSGKGLSFGLKKGETRTLDCYTKISDDNPIMSNIVVKSGEFWTGISRNGKFGEIHYQKNVDVVSPDKNVNRENYNIAIPGMPSVPNNKSQNVESNSNPKWTIQKEANRAYVDPKGELVTYTYTVKNISGEALYYGSMKDDSCWPLKPTSLLKKNDIGEYIEPDASGIWTCTTYVTKTTVGVVDASFKNSQGQASWAGAATYVGVKVDTALKGADYGISRCDVIDFSTQNKTSSIGNLGSFIPPKAPTYGTALPEHNAPRSIAGNAIGRMTTASATSSRFPEYVYYAAKSSTDPNIGLYRVRKDDPKSTEMITADHHMIVGEDGHKERTGATFTNRLGFGPDGRLWSLNQQGFLYSLELDETGHAVGTWKNYGKIYTDKNFGEEPNGDFQTFQLGDVAVDGNNTMWITASMIQGSSEIIGKPNSKVTVGDSRSYLFTLSLNEILNEKQDTKEIVEKYLSAKTPAHFVNRIEFQGYNGALPKGFYGLAFSADGKLYASNDPNAESGGKRAGQIYILDPVTGVATFVFESDFMAGVQDLSSCAFPKPVLSAEKTASEIDPDGNVEFTITVTNSGNLAAGNVVLKDKIETYVAGSATVNGEKVNDVSGKSPFEAGVILKSEGAIGNVIAPGKTVVAKLKAQVKHLGGEVCNQATIAVDQLGQGGNIGTSVLLTDDPTKSREADKTCVSVPRLKIKKTGGNISRVHEDDPQAHRLKGIPVAEASAKDWYKATYLIEISNPGNVAASYSQIEDRFSAIAPNGEEVNSFSRKIVPRISWKGPDGEHKDLIKPTDQEVVKLGTDTIKSLGPKQSHAYTLELYFWAEKDYNWRSEMSKLCNTADIPEGNVDRSENKVCQDIPKNSGKLKIEKAAYNASLEKATVLDNLGGAQFEIYGATSEKTIDLNNKIRSITTNESFDISPGTYFLVEVKAPKGLRLLPEPAKFIVEEENGLLKATSNEGLALSIVNPEQAEGEVTITVNDIYTGTLPLTGGTGIGINAVIALLMMTTAVVLTKRKKIRP